MKCKHERAPINATFCPDCGMRLIEQHDVIRVPVPKRKGNTWYAQVTVDGERVYVSSDSEEGYYAKARATKNGLIEIKKAALKPTLGAVIDTYLNNNSATLSPSTLRGYHTIRDNRFSRYMDMRVDTIDYQRMINEECAEVSPKTVHNAWHLVTAALGENPKVNLPKKPKSDRPWLDYQQIGVFLDAVYGEDCELGALLALHGLRRSEILHLSSDDVDLRKGLIFVRGASVLNSTNELIDKDTNKTTRSSRTVNIVIPRLNDLIKGKSGRLVDSNPNSLWRQINRICEANGLPLVGVHGLRHSYASLAYHLGMDEMTVMREGGWSDPATIHTVYTHLAEQDANADVNKMRKFYAGQ